MVAEELIKMLEASMVVAKELNMSDQVTDAADDCVQSLLKSMAGEKLMADKVDEAMRRLKQMKLVDNTERRVVYLWDLLDDYVGDEAVELDIIRVLDTAGNVVAKADELEIVYDVTYSVQVDPDEQTPEEENGWLRDAGF